MRITLGCLVLLTFFGCNSAVEKEKKVNIVDGSELYEVYKPSEMSSLMKGMYAFNEQMKNEIMNGNEPSEFPEEFLNIHSAQLSDTKTRTDNFQLYSSKYIEAQRLVFVDDSSYSTTQRYNDAIGMCISCHKTECTGPIPKIKKLLIKEE